MKECAVGIVWGLTISDQRRTAVEASIAAVCVLFFLLFRVSEFVDDVITGGQETPNLSSLRREEYKCGHPSSLSCVIPFVQVGSPLWTSGPTKVRESLMPFTKVCEPLTAPGLPAEIAWFTHARGTQRLSVYAVETRIRGVSTTLPIHFGSVVRVGHPTATAGSHTPIRWVIHGPRVRLLPTVEYSSAA